MVFEVEVVEVVVVVVKEEDEVGANNKGAKVSVFSAANSFAN
jgi:hypothetical protein